MNNQHTINRTLLSMLEVRSKLDPHVSSDLIMQLSNCAMDNRIKIFYSPASKPVGYISWAKINKESLQRLINFKTMPPYAYEWNEGHFMVIHDIAVLPIWRNHCHSLFRQFFGNRRFIIFIRRHHVHIWFRHHGSFKRIIFD